MSAASQYLPCPHNPFRRPDRRHMRIHYLLDNRRRPTQDDDEATRAGWHYYRQLNLCHDKNERGRLAQQYPDLAQAHALFRDSQGLQRAEVEARLLANQDIEAIAAKCGLTGEVVRCYSLLYFDVKPFLHSDIYILTVVIGGEKISPVVQADDKETILKIIAFEGGPVALDALLDLWANPPMIPSSFEGLSIDELKLLRRRLGLQAVVQLLTLPVDAHILPVWLAFRDSQTDSSSPELNRLIRLTTSLKHLIAQPVPSTGVVASEADLVPVKQDQPQPGQREPRQPQRLSRAPYRRRGSRSSARSREPVGV